MKSSISILLISMLCATLANSTQMSFSERQYWYNGYLNRTIEINRFADGIEVRGLHSRNGSSWFERRSSNSYYDRYENKLKLINNKVIYYNRRKSSRLTFLPRYSRSQNRHCGNDSRYRDMDYHDYGDNQDDYYDDRNSNHRNRDNERYSNQQGYRDRETNRGLPIDEYRPNSSNTFDKENTNIEEIEGTWQVKDLNKKVYIVETRDGIKARFSDELKWFDYKQGDDKNEFTSENGQKYTLRNGILTWSNHSRSKIFSLSKVSDDMED